MERIDGGEIIWFFDLSNKLFVDLPRQLENKRDWAEWTPYETVEFMVSGFLIKTKDRTIRVKIL